MTKRHTNIGKGIAAILLLCHHLFFPIDISAQTGGQLVLEFWLLSPQLLERLAGAAKICVSFFAFFSGYGTAKSIMERKTDLDEPKTYITHVMKRLLSLLLSFQFVFILTFLLAAGFTAAELLPMNARPYDIYGAFSVRSIGYVLLDFMGISGVLSTPTLNPTWWYISFAMMLIVVIPILFLWCKKTGLFSTMMLYLGSCFVSLGLNAQIYFVVASAGVAAAYCRVFEHLEAAAKGSYKKRAAVLTLLGLSLIVSTAFRVTFLWDIGVWAILDSAVILCVCGIIVLGLGRVPALSDLLAWIGKHSMNIFLVHTFLYRCWLTSHIYSFRYPAVILGVLLAESLLLSVGIELLKKIVRFDRWRLAVTNRLTQWLLLPMERIS